MPDDHSPTGRSGGGTSESDSLVPGLNQIGAMLDDVAKGIQHDEESALRGWVAGAKLLVFAADIHGLKGPSYVQFAIDHLPIQGKTADATERAAYQLHLLGSAQEGQPSNGDLIIAKCEAQAKLRPHFVWPHWRAATKHLRQAAQEAQQGDGIPTADVKEEVEDADPDAPTKDARRPVDPVAQVDADIQKLRSELDAARQSFNQERMAREEAEDALHQLRSNIPRLLSESSEKPLWNTPEPPPPEPSPEPPPDDVVLPEEPSEPDPEPPPDADPPPESLPPDAELPPEPNPEPPPRPPAWDAIALLYRRRQTQTETCETIAEVLHSVPMQDWDRSDFDQLREDLDQVANWGGDHHDLARSFAMHEVAPILFGTADGVLIFEDGLKILTWPEALQRIAPEMERDKQKRELEQRQKRMDDILKTKLPKQRKLKAMKALVDEFMALRPSSDPQVKQAISVIAGMLRDDAKFAACRTVRDYIQAVVCTDPPPELPAHSGDGEA